MDIFSILAIIVICIYVLPRVLGPLLRRFMQWQMQRQMQRMMNNIFGADAQQQQQRRRSDFSDRQSRQRQSSPRQRRGKVFSKSDGEYVEFEEIRTYQQSQSDTGETRVKYSEESQVTDVEWEDL